MGQYKHKEKATGMIVAKKDRKHENGVEEVSKKKLFGGGLTGVLCSTEQFSVMGNTVA